MGKLIFQIFQKKKRNGKLRSQYIICYFERISLVIVHMQLAFECDGKVWPIKLSFEVYIHL